MKPILSIEKVLYSKIINMERQTRSPLVHAPLDLATALGHTNTLGRNKRFLSQLKMR